VGLAMSTGRRVTSGVRSAAATGDLRGVRTTRASCGRDARRSDELGLVTGLLENFPFLAVDESAEPRPGGPARGTGCRNAFVNSRSPTSSPFSVFGQEAFSVTVSA